MPTRLARAIRRGLLLARRPDPHQHHDDAYSAGRATYRAYVRESDAIVARFCAWS